MPNVNLIIVFVCLVYHVYIHFFYMLHFTLNTFILVEDKSNYEVI